MMIKRFLLKSVQKRRRLLIGTTAMALGLTLAACGGGVPETVTPTAVPQTTLRISGSGTTTSILKAIGPAFEADVPGYRLDVLSGTGTGGGVQGVLDDVLDVAGMARPPKDEEAAQGIAYVAFGQSGVAIYTHPDVGIIRLTTDQARAIFSGQFTNWSEVGGPDVTIVLYVRDAGDSSTKALRQSVFGEAPFPETAQVLTSQADMQAAVAGTPGSVGFGSWPSALAAGADVRPIALDGIAPGDADYPIVTPIGIGYVSAREADVQPMVDWLFSEPGQATLSEFGVISTP